MMTNVAIDPRPTPIQTIIIAHIHITISPIHCNSRKTFPDSTDHESRTRDLAKLRQCPSPDEPSAGHLGDPG